MAITCKMSGMKTVKGIHHITAIAESAQKNFDFYTKVLGLRLVKKSVNQDQTDVYHLFYGDKTGEPGMDLTFFTFEPAHQGVIGNGQVGILSLSAPKGSMGFWKQRFDGLKIESNKTNEGLMFSDPDGLPLMLVESDEGADDNVWVTNEIGNDVAIRNFYSARLYVESKMLVTNVIESVLGYSLEKIDGDVSLYKVSGNRASYLEVEERPDSDFGINASGTVHHIAFEVSDEKELLEFRERVIAVGLFPTEVIDRYYFKSVYFRTRAGILFELATSGPGFTVDEDESILGKKLALPPFLENERSEIERLLPKLET